VDDLTPILKTKAIGSNAVENVLQSILGWTHKRVEKLIEAKKPAIITSKEFNDQLITAAQIFDRSDVLPTMPVEISESEVGRELQSSQYIKQLQWIDCEDKELERAVNDYLKSSTQRTNWSERGDVLEASFEDFFDRLERHWRNQQRLAPIELSPCITEIQLGQALYSRCMSLSTSLQGFEVPSYFVPGSYHALADTYTIGWHPRFEDLRRRLSAETEQSTEAHGGADDAVGGP
jgi:hypothetical protein